MIFLKSVLLIWIKKMSLDKLLQTITSLCPENKPELEALPQSELKIGDEVLLIWGEPIKLWNVLAFCNDGCVDIIEQSSKCAMSVPANELRLSNLYFLKD